MIISENHNLYPTAMTSRPIPSHGKRPRVNFLLTAVERDLFNILLYAVRVFECQDSVLPNSSLPGQQKMESRLKRSRPVMNTISISICARMYRQVLHLQSVVIRIQKGQGVLNICRASLIKSIAISNLI